MHDTECTFSVKKNAVLKYTKMVKGLPACEMKAYGFNQAALLYYIIKKICKLIFTARK